MEIMEEVKPSNSQEKESNKELKERVWAESKKIWRIAFPSMLTKITQFGMLVVTQGFIGHIGEVELAAFALVQIITVRFVHGIVLGMSSATETLCGQAFGAKQYHMMGIYLQRSWIINISTATVLLPVFIFTSQIFRLLGQEEDTARKAGNISLWFIPSIYSSIFNFTVEKFLQAQLKNTIVGCLSSITFALHLLLSWILLIKLNLGIPGAMGAMIISNWLVVIGDFAYIFGGRCPKTWRGFTLAAFSDLVPILKLSLSSGLMLCLQLWYTAVLVLLAGYMKNAKTAISAFSICLNITAWDGMLCLGFLAAASVRVSNELGKEDAKAAKFSIKVNLTTSFCIGVFLWIMCLLFGQKIAHLFTSKKAVAEYVSSLSLPLAFSVLLNSIQPIFSGAAVGAGRQSVVAYVNLFCYYAVGVPIGVTLGFAVHLQGIWIGLIVGAATQTLVLACITYRTNWDDQVKKATERLNQYLKPS
ncbi:protein DETOXIFICATION 24-like isoform X2 [Hevea brasiliensis]|uniref:protein DETOXIFICATION 24-like isoform X2 n=1 Tax=Hevea brasiliensis TaxID=3981 RepID=UPI0025E5A09F|nr:protein DETOXIFICATION 24-like isoform X2 [Hevea brasiliensis]